MEDELMKKIAEHDILIKEIPNLRECIHKQEVTNEKILNKIDGLTNRLDTVNNRLDKMDRNFESEKEKTQISWTESIKNAIIKAFEIGVGVLIAYVCTKGRFC